jgi:hypothetical protein
MALDPLTLPIWIPTSSKKTRLAHIPGSKIDPVFSARLKKEIKLV